MNQVGNVVKDFQAGDLGKVSLRYPSMKDAREMKEYLNSMVEEGVEIASHEKVSREEEIDWLSNHLKEIMKGKQVGLVVDIDGNVMGHVLLLRKKKPRVGKLALGLRKEVRGKASVRNCWNYFFKRPKRNSMWK